MAPKFAAPGPLAGGRAGAGQALVDAEQNQHSARRSGHQWLCLRRIVIPDGPSRAIVLELGELDGRTVLDVRRWFRGRPSGRGFALPLDIAPVVADALADLLRRAGGDGS